MTRHTEGPAGTGQMPVRRAIAAPCFGKNPAELADLAVQAEQAGFDGFFVWDHVLFANDGEGPDILDPWVILALAAARTSRIALGTMITPLARRRPWILARQCATLDLLSKGRLILGVGLGSPAAGDFAHFGEVAEPQIRAELLDEGLELLTRFWSGERFSFNGKHFQISPMRFTPTPVQRPRIPIWVGGVLPARRPTARARRWDGAVPIRFSDGRVVRPSVADIAAVTASIATQRANDGVDMAGFDMVIWSELPVTDADYAALPHIIDDYGRAGATWWIETGRPGEDWQALIRLRLTRSTPGDRAV